MNSMNTCEGFQIKYSSKFGEVYFLPTNVYHFLKRDYSGHYVFSNEYFLPTDYLTLFSSIFKFVRRKYTPTHFSSKCLIK